MKAKRTVLLATSLIASLSIVQFTALSTDAAPPAPKTKGKGATKAESSAASKRTTDAKNAQSKSSTPEQKKAAWEIEFEKGLDFSDKGEFEKAEPHYRKALEVLPSKLPLDRAGIEQELGLAIYQLGKYKEALQIFIDSTWAYKTKPEKYKDEIALGYEMLSRTCRHLGRAADAEDFGLKSLNMVESNHGKDSFEYAQNSRNMGKFYLAMYRYIDAEEALKKTIVIYDKTKNMDQDQLAVALELLWHSINPQGKTEESKKILERIVELEKKLNKKIHYIDDDVDPNGQVNLAGYKSVVRYSIKRDWEPPASSEDCRAIAFFQIHRDGKISDLKIDCPSGDQQFDERCLSAIRKAFASPMFLPKGAPETLPISFTFEKTVEYGADVSSSGSTHIDPIAVALKLIDKHNYKEATAILSMPDLSNSIKANLLLCTIKGKLRKYADVEKHARRVISIDPNDVDAHLICADALVRQLKFEEAAKEYKAAIELNPAKKDKEKAQSRLLMVIMDLGQGGSTLRAAMLLSDRKLEAALEMLQKLREKDSKNEAIEFLLSEAYWQLSQPEKALSHIKQAITLNPNDIDYQIRQSWIEQMLGHGQTSMNLLRAIIQKSPPEPELSYVKSLLKSQETQGGELTNKGPGGTDYFRDFPNWNPRRWNLPKDQPLKVYIGSGDYVPGYRDEIKKFMLEAMDVWSANSGGRLKFKLTDDIDNAQIICLFGDDGDTALASASGYTQAFGGSAYITNSLIKIKTEVAGSPLSDEDFRITAIHELGHALGLGHSKNEKDIMYFASASRNTELTDRDKNTLKKLYADDLKFSDWALLDEKGLLLLHDLKAREAISAFETALQKAPKKELITSHLARAYGLALCENLAKRNVSDSKELLKKVFALDLDERSKKRLSDLAKLITVLDTVNDQEREIIFNTIAEGFNSIKRGESSH